jgi:hypothetical protein
MLWQCPLSSEYRGVWQSDSEASWGRSFFLLLSCGASSPSLNHYQPCTGGISGPSNGASHHASVSKELEPRELSLDICIQNWIQSAQSLATISKCAFLPPFCWAQLSQETQAEGEKKVFCFMQQYNIVYCSAVLCRPAQKHFALYTSGFGRTGAQGFSGGKWILPSWWAEGY